MSVVEMPQLGETITEGTVIQWLKSPGDPVALDEPLCEIETEKVNAEIPSPFEGIMGAYLVEEGATVDVGTPICSVEAASPSAESDAQPRETPATPAPPPPPQSTSPMDRGRFYSPVVLRLSQENSLDLDQMTGTGVGGRVTRRDVERYMEALDHKKVPETAPASDGPPLEPRADFEIVPSTATRRAIAERLKLSVSEAPQAWLMVEVDVMALLARRDNDRPAYEREEGRRLTVLPYFVQAVCRSLAKHPELNARWVDGELRRYHSVHCGIAVSAEHGLLVPVIHDAQDLSVAGIARRIDDCATRARERRLTIDDVSGGTITVNNTGAFGSIASRPIVNHPEVANVTLERIVRRPVAVGEDAIGIRSMVNVCLSFDHRAFDGREAGGFLATLKRRLEGSEQ